MKVKKIPEIVPYKTDVEVLTSSFESYREHGHEFYELEYVEQGNGEYVVNGQKFELNKGDLVFVTPMDFHSYMKGNEKFRTITVKFVPESLNFQLRAVARLSSFFIHCGDKLIEAFNLIKEERNSDSFKDLAVRNCLERILILILRENKTNSLNAETLDIEQIIGYINQNFRNALTLDEIAKKCGYSNSHFCRRFKKITGKTFIEYLNSIRISHAKNFLVTTEMTVTDITFECGFGSVRNFNREFLKKYNCTPLEYRRKWLLQNE